jgi:hypothetical protein
LADAIEDASETRNRRRLLRHPAHLLASRADLVRWTDRAYRLLARRVRDAAGNGWSEQAYADLVALAQFLPGPASSQIGIAIGVMRGRAAGRLGMRGSASRMPSALVMLVAAYRVDLAAGGIGAGVAARTEARRRRRGRAGGVGHGRQPLPGPHERDRRRGRDHRADAAAETRWMQIVVILTGGHDRRGGCCATAPQRR